jgi:hypothetical protein
MRARRRLILGWSIVVVYAAALMAVALTTEDGRLRPGDRTVDAVAAEALVDAWERSLTATFVRFGTFERHSDQTGATIGSEDVLAQRPPRRLHRQLGGVEGRDDRRAIVCPGAPDPGAPLPCTFGSPTGPSYDDDVAAEVEGLRSLVLGPDPVYAVVRAAPGCFSLAQLRSEPRALFGIEARFCFDAETGAPTAHRVRHPRGVVEVLAVTEVRSTVRDADLEP